jgi:hypothetical protein
MRTKSCTINNWKKLIRDYKINEERSIEKNEDQNLKKKELKGQKK